jgi:hypothetical protein
VITWADLQDRRDTRDKARERVRQAEQRLILAQGILETLLSEPRPDPDLVDAAMDEVDAATRDAAQTAATATAAEAAYAADLAALPGQLDPAVPCLLLPIRLETRFTTTPGGATLRVRMYPDEIHLDSHERQLTDGEVRVGVAYWQALWEIATEAAPGPGSVDTRPARRIAAWEQVTRRLGPARGALVAAALTPTNQPPDPPAFPAAATAVAPWTRPAWAAALPERWTVRAWRHDQDQPVAEAHGELIRRPLPAGPGPQGLDPDTEWTTDYDQAVAAGMAVTLDVGQPRVDVLTVVGVRGTDTPAQGAFLLAGLLQAHHFTGGLDLLPAGTPTNNTPRRRTGVGAHPEPAERSYHYERAGLDVPGASARRPAPGTDAAQLSAAFGLDTAAAARPADVLPGTGGAVPDPLATVPHLADRGLADARDMAAVLWPATWGYYGTQLLEEDDLLRRYRPWILDTVAGGGPLPTLRVGSQPYGVLPVTPLHAWRPWPDEPDLAVLTTLPSAAVLAVGLDLDPAHRVQGPWVSATAPPGLSAGWALGAGDVDGDGADDLVALTVSPGGQNAWLTTGHADVGNFPVWGPPVEVPTGHPVMPSALPTGRCGIAVASFPGLDAPSVVVVFDHIDPSGGGVNGSVRVGVGLSVDRVQQWSDPVELPAVPLPPGLDAVLTGACVTAIEDDGRPALALLYALTDGRLGLRIGRGLTALGVVADGWSDLTDVPITADATVHTASVTANPASGRALLVHYSAVVAGQATSQYVVAPALTATGAIVPGWAGPFPAPGAHRTAIAVAVAVLAWERDFTPGLTSPTRGVNLLVTLRRAWQNVLGAGLVPRIVPAPARSSPQSLLDVLSSDAVSDSVRTRGAIGPTLAGNLWFLLRAELGPHIGDGYQERLRDAVAATVAFTGVDVHGRISRLGYETDASTFPDPLVAQADHEQEPLPGPANYLLWAAGADPVGLHAGFGGRGGTAGPLLERLVRHATLQVWADAAFAIRPPDNVALPLLDPELVEVPDLTDPDKDKREGLRKLTSWRHLSEAVFARTHPRYPGRSVLDVLAELVATAEAPGGTLDPAVADLVAHRAALRRLSQLPAGTLQRLLMQTLDVATHRLDAWVTAVATSRLRQLRAARPDGLHLGAYGVALDLTARSTALSEGHVLAPSLAHAATAAIARSGYLAHADDAYGGRLALDLTSRRTRQALDLLDGLRRGQPLATLLGQRFERGLHDLPGNLDRYLGTLRVLAPAAAGKRTALALDTGAGAAQARGPLDGLALLRMHTAGTIPWGTTPAGETVALPPADPADPGYAAITSLLAGMQDQNDAVGDLALAEALHQTVQGNPVRAGALLDAVNRGEPTHADDPDVVRTPRSGVALTHRVLVLLPDAQPAAWSPQPAPAARAAAEPALEAWAASILGPTARTRWRATFPADDAAGTVTADYTMTGLGLCALDVVAAATAPDVQAAGDLARSATLDSLLLTHAAANPPPGSAPGAAPTLLLNRAPGWASDELSVPELLEVGRRLGVLLTGARPARTADLAEPGHDPGDDNDPTLASRAATALAGLHQALAALRAEFPIDAAGRAALAGTVPGVDVQDLSCALDLPGSLDLADLDPLAGQPANPAAVRSALRTLALYGVPGAAAEAPVGNDAAAQTTLLRQAHRIARVAAGRIAAAATPQPPAAVLHAVLGDDVVVLPRIRAANSGYLRDALAARVAAGDAGPVAISDWLAEAAEVRAGAARLRDLRLAAAACARDTQTGLRVAQLPPPAAGGTDRWAALPLPDTDPPAALPGGLVNIVLTGPALAASPSDVLAGPLAGLLVDEWVEIMPGRMTTAAVSFHVDAPGASPPQTMLLAVSPDPNRRWSIDLLDSTLQDTLALAQERMVDPDFVPSLGHLLPALLLARNNGDAGLGDTIASGFPPT